MLQSTALRSGGGYALPAIWIAVLLWGLTGLLNVLVQWNLACLNCVRGFAGCLVLWMFVGWAPRLLDRVESAGAFCCGLNMVLFTVALRESNPTAAIVEMYTAPIYTAVLGYFFLKEQMPRYFVLVCVIVVVGMACIVIDERRESALLGHAAGLLSGVTYALFTTCRAMRPEKDAKHLLLWAFLGTGLVFLPSLLEESSAGRMSADAASIGGAVSYGVVGAVAMLLFAYSLKHVSTTTALLIAAAEVPLIPLLASIKTHQFPGILTIVGGMLVLAASLYLSLYAAAGSGPRPDA